MSLHLWSVAAADGGAVVTTAESMSGWLIQVLTLVATRFLDDALLAWLAALKRRAETAA